VNDGPDSTPAPTRAGCCLITGIGGLIGLVSGAVFGVKEFNEAVERAARLDPDVDFLPVVVPFFAFVGAVFGALAAGMLGSAWGRWRS
jgi:ABC-type antimicrobial peptide transport system permease subunit